MNDLLPVAKAAEELEPTVRAFAEATGLTQPIQEIMGWLTDLIRYRRAPHQAKLLMRAAEKINAAGVPSSAVSDKLLRAVLEEGAMEDDTDMQDRWANLLANASTKSANVRAAFPPILSELDPGDAQLLDTVYTAFDQPSRSLRIGLQADFAALGNLRRLGLVRYTFDTVMNLGDVYIESLGWAFVQACRAPLPPGP